MTVYDQPVTTYSDTTPHVRVIGDAIHLIDPVDTPLLDLLGLDSARSKFLVRENGYKIEILEDEHDPLSTTANQGTTITTNTTTLTVTDASIFQDGHVILIDAEYMVVKTADATGNTLTVYSRSYGGTNATHTTASTITIVGMARLEGDDADFGPVVDITAPYNYTSIFQKALKVTGTMQAISQYGKTNEKDYQANKALPHLFRLLESSLFHGIRSAGTASAPRSMGSIGSFLSSNTVAAGGAIAKADIDGLAEEILLNGGMPDTLVLHPSIANDLRTLLDNSSFIRVTQQETQFGMKAIKSIETQYGMLRMIEDRWCPLATAYMLDSRKVGTYQLRPFGWHDIAKAGDSEKIEVVGEFSLLVANEKAHGTITGITS
jgi:hypothetical protein